MKPRRPGEPAFQRGLQNAGASRERGAGVLERQVTDKRFWTDPDIAFEQALEMEERKACHFGRLFKARLFGVVFGEIADGARNATVTALLLVALDGACHVHGPNMGRKRTCCDPFLARSGPSL